MMKENVHSKGIKAILVSLFLFLGIVTYGGSAFSFEYVLSFGDSLTDNYVSPDPTGYFGLTDVYGFGVWTDDQVWVEYLADNLKVPLYDMAFGGACAAFKSPRNPVSLYDEVDNIYLPSYSSDVTKNTLVTVWIGGNDCLANIVYGVTDPSVLPNNSAGYAASILSDLYDAGFRKFLVLTVPDVGQTLKFKNTQVSSYLSNWCIQYNSSLIADLNILRAEWKGTGATIFTIDAFALVAQVQADPTMYSKKYGIDEYADMFWIDGFHPSSKAHRLLADIASKVVRTAN